MYRVGIDSGGTFTDLVGIDADGRLVVAKHASTPRAPMEAFLGVIGKSRIASAEIERIAHGTTVATNAIIQRQGARVAFVITRGFEDVPFIQRINRRREYDLHWQKPQPLVRRRWCVGVGERMNANGEVTLPLDERAMREVAAAIHTLQASEPPEAIAICLLFAFLNPRHEIMLGEYLAEEFPELPISLSHQVAPIWREYERSSTVLAEFLCQAAGQRLLPRHRPGACHPQRGGALLDPEIGWRHHAAGKCRAPAGGHSALRPGRRAGRRPLLGAPRRHRRRHHARHGRY